MNPATVVNSNNKINPVLTIESRVSYPRPLLVHVALLENIVGTNRNVLRKLLFGPDGLTLTNSWVAGQISTIDRGAIDINVPIVSSGQLTLIAWVQDKTTKEIFQSTVLAAPRKKGGVTVGLEVDPATTTTVHGIGIYPNPANGKFNFNLPGDNNSGFGWKVADQRGVIIASGDFADASDNRLQVDVSGLANGVYIVMISGPDKSVAYHKLVVMNRN